MKLETVIKKLKEHNIDFYITGSFAVHIYTGIRQNSDIDFAVRKSDMDHILKIFKQARVLYLNKKGYRVKSIRFDYYEFSAYDNFPKGITFEVNDKRLSKYHMFRIDGYVCDVVSVEDLILLKLLLNRNAGTKQDNDDIRLLLRTQKYSRFYLILRSFRSGVLDTFLNLYRNRFENSPISEIIHNPTTGQTHI